MSSAPNHNDTATRGVNRKVLHLLSSGLTVRMIMTPRSSIVICAPDESIAEVIQRNQADRFSFIPVMNGNHFVGLLHTERWFREDIPVAQVSEHLEPLSESNLIGGNASILDFVMAADARPCRLVVSGERIEGLVSLSDLQQLPVRSALFAMITGIELCMSDLIRDRHTEESWLSLLSKERAKKISDEISQSKGADGFVDALLFTQFSDKSAIVRKTLSKDALGTSKGCLKKSLDELRELRDNLAHANEYAATPSEGRNVCKLVREAFKLLETLEQAIQKTPAHSEAQNDCA